MRAGKKRIEKYKAKIDGTISQLRLLRYGKTQNLLFKAKIIRMVEIENIVKGILSEWGAPTIFNHFYMNFAKKIIRLDREEIDIELNKWKERGLSEPVLNAIAEILVGRAPPIIYFRLDISLLDGPDVLS